MPNVKLSQLVLLIMVAGCATQPGKNNGADHVTAANDLQCHTEAVTGTLVGRKVCTTQTQRDAQQATLTDIQRAAQGGLAACRPNTAC
jgi:hypothetical protein